MAKGNIIDASTLYRAGFSSKAEAEDLRKKQKREFWQGAANTAYNVLGTAAIGQIKEGYRNLQIFRNKSDSQTAYLNLKLDKMPKDNPHLEASVIELKRLYRKASRQAAIGIGKKRAKGREDMTRYMKQLQDMNAFLETYLMAAEKSQSMMTILSGVAGKNNQAGSKNMNPGTDAYQFLNTSEQANGLMGKNLRWDIESGQMMVLRGGVWKKDENGNDIYVEKGGAGTYEDYVKELSELDETIDYGPGTRYGKKDSSEITKPPLSKEEWEELNREAGHLINPVLYSDLRFAREEDDTMENDMVQWEEDLVAEAWKANSKPWDLISGNMKLKFQSQINGYNDDQFRDFYFGGFSFDHSANRMGESAPAYMKLRAEDAARGNLNDDLTWKEGFGPGSADWEGRLLSLKSQSFVKGSYYRQEAVKDLWSIMKEKYEDTQKEYKKANPDPIDPAKDPAKVYGVDDGQYGIPREQAVAIAETMRGKGTSYVTKTEKWVQDGKGKSTRFFLLPKADNTGYEWVEQETIPTNDAIQLRKLNNLGVSVDIVEPEEGEDVPDPNLVPEFETDEDIDPRAIIPKVITKPAEKKRWLEQEIAKVFEMETPDQELLDALNKQLKEYK
jgi:hypothetical protein